MQTDSNTVTVAEVARGLRKELAATFPGVAFRVRKMGRSSILEVCYTDGPDSREVEAIACRYEAKKFDGLIDLAIRNTHWRTPDGRLFPARSTGTQSLGGCIKPFTESAPPDAVEVYSAVDYVYVARHLSDDYRAQLLDALIELTGEPREVFGDGYGHWNGRPIGSILRDLAEGRCMLNGEIAIPKRAA